MPIRFATQQDIPQMIEVGAILHEETRFCQFRYDPWRVSRALHQIMGPERERYACLVAENGASQIVGVLIGVLQKHIFSAQAVGSIMHFLVLPEKRMGGYAVRLLRAFEKWCRCREVAEIAFGVNTHVDMDRIAEFAVRMSYIKVGDNFVKHPSFLGLRASDLLE